MPRVRKIYSGKESPRNYYLVDANFLANKHIAPRYAPAGRERDRVEACQAWWAQVDSQLDAGEARVFAPDLCIAEAFKVLAKKYYRQSWFPNAASFGAAKRGLSRDVRTTDKALRAQRRNVRFHDISTNRDIIVSVDRFFELFHRKGKNVGIVDLILVATAKYLMDFYDIPKPSLHIVTLDTALREGIAAVTELPNAYDPTLPSHRAELVFS
jgi:hypothetical protein